ncbi:MAG: hypothetical protein HQK96_09300 [Nitrospirae bacterium]|nr:hypothetical protein [Nitrospirota bacterium]
MLYLSEQVKASKGISTLKPSELYKLFPKVKESTLRYWLVEFKKRYSSIDGISIDSMSKIDSSIDNSTDTTTTKSPEDVNNDSINSSIDATIEESADNINIDKRDIIRSSVYDSTHVVASADDSSIRSSIIDSEMIALLKTLKDNKSLLESMIENEKGKDARLTIQGVKFDVEGLVKTGKELNRGYNYNLSIELHDEFEKACESVGLSYRKGVHVALKLFVDSIKKP